MDPAKIFFTSDTHYAHRNICAATSRWTGDRLDAVLRPHLSLAAMNDAIVEGINRVVPEDGVLYHLGDWSFGGRSSMFELRGRINCGTVHLVLGNHDTITPESRVLFAGVHEYLELAVPASACTTNLKASACTVTTNLKVVLFHYPIDHWNKGHRGSLHLHGHMHYRPEDRIKGRRMDVGVDGRRGSGKEYEPYSLIEVVDLLHDGASHSHH